MTPATEEGTKEGEEAYSQILHKQNKTEIKDSVSSQNLGVSCELKHCSIIKKRGSGEGASFIFFTFFLSQISEVIYLPRDRNMSFVALDLG